jgi:C-terminal processing protease CtpA/Prc
MVPQGLPQRARPAFLARRNTAAWTALLDRGRSVYVAYNQTLGWSGDVAARVRRLARRPSVRGIVLDLRHNPGGENRAYAPLLDALVSLGRRERIVVLTSRTTFSAAANLLSDLEARTRIRVVGEPSGGSPNLVGDPSPIALQASGWSVNVGSVWWAKSRRGDADPRLAFTPDVRVPLRWSDLAAGRDAALVAALLAARA